MAGEPCQLGNGPTAARSELGVLCGRHSRRARPQGCAGATETRLALVDASVSEAGGTGEKEVRVVAWVAGDKDPIPAAGIETVRAVKISVLLGQGRVVDVLAQNRWSARADVVVLVLHEEWC